MSRYWQSTADLTFLRHDTRAKTDGSLVTQVSLRSALLTSLQPILLEQQLHRCSFLEGKAPNGSGKQSSGHCCAHACISFPMSAYRDETNQNVTQEVPYWPGFIPNTAQIIPPETRSGQRALNGDLHVVRVPFITDTENVMNVFFPLKHDHIRLIR